ncbi:MAG: thiamine phosphate synthase [Phycisphaerales bacterium]
MNPLRIIDANANRAREAARTLEEAARFLLDDRDLSAQAKAVRHGLVIALEPLGSMVAHRDITGDVGTALTGDRESERAGPADVVAAAAARLTESLRTIEEWAKTLEPGRTVAPAVEALRYASYELERRLRLALERRPHPQWTVCVLITAAGCLEPWADVAAAAIAGGADCVQLREPELAAGELLSRARQLVALAGRRAAIVINDRPDVALAAGADGVHLGQTDLPAADARRLAGDRLHIGVSTRTVEHAAAALRGGADGCGIGPMFASPTKPHLEVAGPAALTAYLAWGRLPHLAIGGIDAPRAEALAAIGARGVAVSSAVCQAGDPGAATQAIVAAMTRGAAMAEAASGATGSTGASAAVGTSAAAPAEPGQ